jgi:MFS family permease
LSIIKLLTKSRGIIATFGTYQAYYEINILSSQTPSDISWIGSIQGFLLLLVSAATGPLFDAGYFRHLVALGSFMIVFGVMMTSIATEYWQIMLAQGFCIGIGAGFVFVPGVSILPTYFSTKKALATGIATSGSSLGKFSFLTGELRRVADEK